MKEWTGPDLVKWYTALLNAFGPRNWWPADSAFETIIGAILAQNVSWNGAYQAACALKEAGLMDAHALIQAGPDTIAPLIRSSRYYNQKAQRIIIFLTWFFETCHGDISTMASWDLGHIRRELLHLSGFGPETVDSILLYALEKPVFVVDAYTRRIGYRQGWFHEHASYADMQQFFMDRVSPDIPLYNDFHAQIVYLGNAICKKTPRCTDCPVRKISRKHQCQYALNMGRSAPDR